jgi:hypothetical protein
VRQGNHQHASNILWLKYAHKRRLAGIKPRDADLGLELHGVVERAWSSRVNTGDDPAIRYGLGLAAVRERFF